MKLSKFAIIGLVSVCASAISLEDAIQDVELNGMLRYRYDTTRVKDIAANIPAHKYRVDLKFGAKIADNYKAFLKLKWEDKSYQYGSDAYIKTNSTFAVKDAFFTYSNFNTDFSFGRMEIPSMFNDGVLTTGGLISLNPTDGLIINAFLVDNIDIDDSDLISSFDTVQYKLKSSGAKITPYLNLTNTQRVFQNNIYGLNINYTDSNINTQVGLDYIDDFGSFYGAFLAAKLGDKKALHYGVDVQISTTKLAKGIKEHFDAKDAMFYGIEANIGYAGAKAEFGYVGFGKKDKVSFAAWHDKGQLLRSGKIIMDGYHGSIGKRDYVYTNLSYKYDDLRFLLSVISGDTKVLDTKYKQFEIMPKVVYKHSKKLKFSAYYDYAKTKFGYDNIKEYKTRFEAKYSF